MVGGQILGKRVRHLSRYKDIAQILVANGFGWFIDEIGLFDILSLPRRIFSERRERETISTYERMRLVIEQLGPTFIKLGQIASLRADVFPPEFIEQLAKLQDEVPPVAFDQIRTIVETELGQPLTEMFRVFDEVPVGAASIGQVHRAELQTGEEVAVKVQRPDIQQKIEIDLDILMDLARLAERHFEWAAHYELSQVVEEFRYTLLNELNYTIEGRNADRLRKIHEGDTTVRIPEIFWDWSTSRVLTMEYVRGIKLTNGAFLRESGYRTGEIAQRVAHAEFTQMLMHGFFHADPHPGNLAVLPDHSVLFMDFGMVGRLTPEMKRHLSGLIIALMRRDSDAIVRVLYRMGVVPNDVDDRRLHRDVDNLREKYYDLPFTQISLGDAVSELFSVAYRHRIKIPSDLALVGKTLVTVEGVVEGLEPSFRILNIAEPFGRALLRERMNPRQFVGKAFRGAIDTAELLTDVPRQIRGILREWRRGKVRVQLEMAEVDQLMRQLIRIGNRLSFSITLLAFSIFMAGLLIATVLKRSPSALWSFPTTEVGVAVGLFMVFILIISIWRSSK
ncbi:2-octaprenylphenol hydroxylase [Alicyclobacillus sacchari]|uniref:2-octaprenylphenol hydroxylase n=1 Tax=Alicyclobacillus sacchari TaxID=392010 RepID=A0A4R8LNN7_9BACL|nr:AarF/ABC1/UbiB kinase family protein [Alicyclobacillus sacchari]TDY45260.1 2-octaprenylphenol hydroxylase [Alicyclobacillus sacchari]GMA56876.1 ABC transporter [Alicyclobacillus sacchari]